MTNIEAIDHIIDIYSKKVSINQIDSIGDVFICIFLKRLVEEGKINAFQEIDLCNIIHKNKKLANTNNDLYYGGSSFWLVYKANEQGRFKELMQLKIDFLNKIKPLV